MAKQNEIDYPDNIGVVGMLHAMKKPFSDPNCARYLMELGAVMALLPLPPAKILDAGCGTGWTSFFFARRGYEVTGLDIAKDMIETAMKCKQREGLPNLNFIIGDYESLPVQPEFDAIVFFDSLHHADNELPALQMAMRALKPGGICVTSEPGKGHARSTVALHAVKQYGVNEKDMPPLKIWRAAKKAGFKKCRVYPHASQLTIALYGSPEKPFFKRLFSLPLMRIWAAIYLMVFHKKNSGIVMLQK